MKNINKKPIDPRENENKNRRMKSIFFFGKKNLDRLNDLNDRKNRSSSRWKSRKPNQKNGQKKIVNL